VSDEQEVTIEATTAGTGGIKLFGEWSFENIEVRDPGLKRYLKISPVFMPHSGGRHEARKFQKSEMSIVERLTNDLLKPGSSGGDKPRVMNAVRTAFKIIYIKSGRNPIEVLVRAVENCSPNEDTTRIGYGGVVYRLAVDISPQRRVSRSRPSVTGRPSRRLSQTNSSVLPRTTETILVSAGSVKWSEWRSPQGKPSY
jgi:small subunit ribosomal protein S7